MALAIEQCERIRHGRTAFGLLVGDVKIEFFLERHGERNQIERVSTKVAKGRIVDDTGRRHSEMFGNQPARAFVHPLAP